MSLLRSIGIFWNTFPFSFGKKETRFLKLRWRRSHTWSTGYEHDDVNTKTKQYQRKIDVSCSYDEKIKIGSRNITKRPISHATRVAQHPKLQYLSRYISCVQYKIGTNSQQNASLRTVVGSAQKFGGVNGQQHKRMGVWWNSKLWTRIL